MQSMKQIVANSDCILVFQASAEAKFGSMNNQKNMCCYFAVQKICPMVVAEIELPKAQRKRKKRIRIAPYTCSRIPYCKRKRIPNLAITVK